MQEIQKRLGQRVRRLREKKGWSQEEFAHISGIHRTYVGAIERGEKNLTMHTLQIVSRSLGLTIHELFKGIG